MPPMSTSISKYNYTIFVSRNRYPDEAVVVVESKKIGRQVGVSISEGPCNISHYILGIGTRHFVEMHFQLISLNANRYGYNKRYQ